MYMYVLCQSTCKCTTYNMYMRKAQFFSNENHVEWGSVLVVMSSSLPTVVPLTTGHVTRVMDEYTVQ